MAILSSNDRAAISADFQRKNSDIQASIAVTKPNLALAITAIAQWVDDNQASFNAAIPLPARTALTTKQKAQLFMLVVSQTFVVTP